jgi:hypothetical protein
MTEVSDQRVLADDFEGSNTYSHERRRQVYQCEDSDNFDGSIVVNAFLRQSQNSSTNLSGVGLIANIEKICELCLH